MKHPDLAAAIAGLPDSALLPVSWIRMRMDPSEEEGPEVPVDLTVQEVGDLLSRSPSAVRAWIKAGQLPGAYKLMGKEWRIPPSALEAFQEAQRSGPTEKATNPPKRRGRADLGAWRSVK